MDIEDEARSGRPTVDNVDKIMKIVGLKKKLDVWVSHKLTQNNLLDRIDVCKSLLKCNEIDPFSKRTDVEKWVNMSTKAEQDCGQITVKQLAKRELTSKKVTLCVWWDWK
nr:histone-lysine N-methyltransferase SETMAR-like [Lepeophtheirus salmonis]